MLTADVDGDQDFDANDSFLIHLVRQGGTDSHIDQFRGDSPFSAVEIRAAIAQLSNGGNVDGDADVDEDDSLLTHLANLSTSDTSINQARGGSPLTASEIRENVSNLDRNGGNVLAVASEGAGTITATPAPLIRPLNEGWTQIGQAVDVHVDNENADPSLLTFVSGQLPEGHIPAIAHDNGDSWELVAPNQWDASAGVARLLADDFSQFSLVSLDTTTLPPSYTVPRSSFRPDIAAFGVVNSGSPFSENGDCLGMAEFSRLYGAALSSGGFRAPLSGLSPQHQRLLAMRAFKELGGEFGAAGRKAARLATLTPSFLDEGQATAETVKSLLNETGQPVPLLLYHNTAQFLGFAGHVILAYGYSGDYLHILDPNDPMATSFKVVGNRISDYPPTHGFFGDLGVTYNRVIVLPQPLEPAQIDIDRLIAELDNDHTDASLSAMFSNYSSGDLAEFRSENPGLPYLTLGDGQSEVAVAVDTQTGNAYVRAAIYHGGTVIWDPDNIRTDVPMEVNDLSSWPGRYWDPSASGDSGIARIFLGQGIHDLTIVATDTADPLVRGRTALTHTKLQVAGAPEITSADTGRIDAAAVDPYVRTVTAADLDENDELTFSISDGRNGADFSIEASSGRLVYEADPDFSTVSDNDGDGVFEINLEVEVTVTDMFGLTDSQVITVTVTAVAPVITSGGGEESAVYEASSETSAVTTVTASDEDHDEELGLSDVLTFSLSGGDDISQFSISAESGELSFGTIPDFANPTDSDNDGIYEVEVTVTDRFGLKDSQQITVEATAQAPVITSGGGDTAVYDATEGQTSVTTVIATDADVDDVLTYSISDGADASRFSIDSTSGELTFNSVPDFENPTDANRNGVYEIEVTVTDTFGLTDTQNIHVAALGSFTLISVTGSWLKSGNAAGQIEILAGGGIRPYEYSIDNGVTWSTNSAITHLDDARYRVKVRDAMGAEVEYGTPVDVNQAEFIVDTMVGQRWQDNNGYRSTPEFEVAIETFRGVRIVYGRGASGTSGIELTVSPVYDGDDVVEYNVRQISTFNGFTFEFSLISFSGTQLKLASIPGTISEVGYPNGRTWSAY